MAFAQSTLEDLTGTKLEDMYQKVANILKDRNKKDTEDLLLELKKLIWKIRNKDAKT